MRDGRKGIAQKEQGNDLEFAIKINRGKLDSRNSSAPNKMSAGTLGQHLFRVTRRTNRRSVLRRRDVSVSSRALDARLRVVSK